MPGYATPRRNQINDATGSRNLKARPQRLKELLAQSDSDCVQFPLRVWSESYITLHSKQAAMPPIRLQNNAIGIAAPVCLTLVPAKYTLAT